MKYVISHATLNVLILTAVIIFNTFYHSELGGPGTLFNTISFFLLIIFLLLNNKLYPFLFLTFSIPLIFLLLSTLLHTSILHEGGYHSALATSVGYILLTLKNPPIDKQLLKKIIFLYLISVLLLSVFFYFERIVLSGVGGSTAGNANFHSNPNAAALCFFNCLIFSIVFVSGLWRLVLIFSFNVLVLTTGSRAGFLTILMINLGYIFFEAGNAHVSSLLRVKGILLRTLTFLMIFLAIFYFLSDSFSFLQERLSNIGFSLGSRSGGMGRDDIWKLALEASFSSTSNLLFGTGPATAAAIIDSGTHSSYMEAITSIGWPFMISTLVALSVLLSFHKKCEHYLFLVISTAILTYGVSSTELFCGLSSIWWTFIFLSIYYRDFGSNVDKNFRKDVECAESQVLL